ncbi:hypothetical protein VNI00_019426 [Paramarasmius palmivorus]|uniref:RNA polymerase II elongation factor ELL N-terminal domain-containing protein n=1 Tax=Paramarasmius palmivorus TaxID=297713 RepID=A0AAW0AMS4_9AGAR
MGKSVSRGCDLLDRIRQKREVEEEKRNQSKTIMLDGPPPPQKREMPTATTQKKKTANSTMFRKPVKASDQPQPSRPRAPQLASSNSTANTKENALIKKKVIHLLALGEKTAEDVVRTLGSETDVDVVMRRTITDVLEEVAEPLPSSAASSTKLWQLKSLSWIHVRPFEWPGLSDHERVTIARTARRIFHDSRIPETEECWRHCKQPPSQSQAQPSGEVKKGLMGSQVKKAKEKDREVVKSKEKEIPMKPPPPPPKVGQYHPYNLDFPHTYSCTCTSPKEGRLGFIAVAVVPRTLSCLCKECSITSARSSDRGIEDEKEVDLSPIRHLSKESDPSPIVPKRAGQEERHITAPRKRILRLLLQRDKTSRQQVHSNDGTRHFTATLSSKRRESDRDRDRDRERERAQASLDPAPQRVKRLKEEAGVESDRGTG